MRQTLVSFFVLCWVCLGVSSASRAEGIPHATWLPASDPQIVSALTYLRAQPTVATLKERLEAPDFQTMVQRWQGHLLTLPENDKEKLVRFRNTLIQEGFDPLNIVSTERSDRLKTKLKHSVCYVVGGKASRTQLPAILVTMSLDRNDIVGTAGILALAKLMQDFQLMPKRPIWLCAMPRLDTERAGVGMKELLHPNSKDNFNPRNFRAHLALHGLESAGFGNYLGMRTTRYEFQERQFHWPNREANNAYSIAKESAERFQSLTWPWQKNRKETPARIHLSKIICDKSIVSHARSSCRFDVTIQSRSKQVLDDCIRLHSKTATEATNEFNRALKQANGHPGIALKPHTLVAISPQAYKDTSLPLTQVFQAVAGDTPNTDMMLWSRFIESEAVYSSASHLPNLTTGMQPPNPFDTEEQVKRLRRLFEALGLLSGLDVDGTSIAPVRIEPPRP